MVKGCWESGPRETNPLARRYVPWSIPTHLLTRAPFTSPGKFRARIGSAGERRDSLLRHVTLRFTPAGNTHNALSSVPLNPYVSPLLKTNASQKSVLHAPKQREIHKAGGNGPHPLPQPRLLRLGAWGENPGASDPPHEVRSSIKTGIRAQEPLRQAHPWVAPQHRKWEWRQRCRRWLGLHLRTRVTRKKKQAILREG